MWLPLKKRKKETTKKEYRKTNQIRYTNVNYKEKENKKKFNTTKKEKENKTKSLTKAGFTSGGGKYKRFDMKNKKNYFNNTDK